MKIWGHINFEKKSQKREFSLGNIGESPKNENVLGVLFIIHTVQEQNSTAAILMGDLPMLSFKMGDSPTISFRMGDLSGTFLIFSEFTYVT